MTMTAEERRGKPPLYKRFWALHPIPRVIVGLMLLMVVAVVAYVAYALWWISYAAPDGWPCNMIDGDRFCSP